MITLDGLTGITTPGETVSGTGVWSVGGTQLYKDSSGNLGLGVTPSAWSGVGPGILELRGNAYIASTSQVLSLDTNCYFNGTSWVYKSSSYANRYDTIFGEHRWYTAPSGTAGNAISFTQAMTLDASGNLMVGTTGLLATERMRVSSSSSFNLIVDGQNTSGDRALYLQMGTNTVNTSSYFIECATGGVGTKFYVYGNGTYGSSSDIRLKKNIETTRDGYLEDVCKLRVVKYNWETDADDAPKELGWIAQELMEVFPGLVQDGKVEENGISYKQVKNSVLPFILLKAIQELSAELNLLKQKVNA